MKLLSIETSTMVGGVAIMDDDTLIAESRINVRVTHSERIMTAIDHILMQSGMKIEDIDVFAIAIGPGSFTGLRVGLSTAKGLVYASGKKLVSVPTLEAFAWNVSFSRYQVCPLLDARKKEVYAGLFRWEGNGFLRIKNEQTVRIDKLLLDISEPTIFLGEGAVIYKDSIKERLKDFAIFGNPQNMVPCPANVAYIGMIKAKKGEFEDPVKLVPLYIRRSEAEIKQPIA
ncbi:tRNA (adenosine(37)-N6)-threonylcarbamoyltransferase complex dimerization subunit type 1 TsaB [Dissulfurispira thermophila]|uniref:tRNA (Adenosine(37)-N6)-threonylcarbamoyltransferase complex dimerization subunit type 1 TsaB n=2 Tax=root TaxID=1 RepID=A0A7G1GZZ6_9BACT|nr:tRNA (adenosine(37)-N6)-threonylcarbamoyltransferase complex dimerization subunit type 1 TsaB [Dissulfurispira thermophila]BCB95838.1 tRNA (adenosine(37)-N6)-threonylcarbamoyltransferase complex dimerization subunit type 1 TsaB [Dissulfurispira thermophila]